MEGLWGDPSLRLAFDPKTLLTGCKMWLTNRGSRGKGEEVNGGFLDDENFNICLSRN